MDSIDDSLLSRVLIHIAHLADRRLHENGPVALVLATALTTLYYTLFGGLADAVLLLLATAVVAATTRPRRLERIILASRGLSWLGFSLVVFVVSASSLVIFLRLVGLVAGSGFGRNQRRRRHRLEIFFIPSRTTHVRFFPEKHSFTYSYLTVGIPVGVRSSNVNGILSVDSPAATTTAAAGRRRWWWWWWSWLLAPVYDVDCADHLARGVDKDKGGLREKLSRFLARHQVDPALYTHAFLVTAPKFLGYSFNPVSFWYLYSPDRVLSAMILEVNNTFDERRPYLVFRDFVNNESCATTANNAATAAAAASTAATAAGSASFAFRASFDKDFHVSPFNSRKGSYSVLARDALGPDMQGFGGLDVTITLHSSKGRRKLVARLVSHGPAMAVSTMSVRQKLAFIGQWFWVGFVTFPRIVKEAAVLVFRRRLHVWYRPEPLQPSMGRRATGTERVLEAVFRAYLRRCVERAPRTLCVRYVPSGIAMDKAEDGDGEGLLFMSRTAGTEVAAAAEEEEEEEVCGGGERDGAASTTYDVEIRVLTPAFYARFVHYAHDVEGIFNELVESATVTVSKPEMVPLIFGKSGAAVPFATSSVTDYVYFTLIKSLRRVPEPIGGPRTLVETGKGTKKKEKKKKEKDIRRFRISSMDAHVLGHGSDTVKRKYRSAVLRLFVSDYFFGGSVEMVVVVEWAWRVVLAYGVVSICLGW